MHYLFLDTNIFLHFKDFEQIEWKKLLNTKDNIEIVFAPTVISELDKHKYDSNRNKANKAKKIIKKVKENILSNVNSNIKISISPNLLNTQIFTDKNLDKSNQDDCILATIIDFKNKLNGKDKVTFVTDDTNFFLKCLIHNVVTLELPDEYLIIEESEEKKKIKQLEKEINFYKNCEPIITISIDNETNHPVIKKPIIEMPEWQTIEVIKDEIWNKFKKPYVNISELDSEFKDSIWNNSMFSLEKKKNENIIKFNNSLNYSLLEVSKYLYIIQKKDSFNLNYIEVYFSISNNGSVPAKDLKITVEFEGNLKVFKSNEIPKFEINDYLYSQSITENIKLKQEIYGLIRMVETKKTYKPCIDIINIKNRLKNKIYIDVPDLMHTKKLTTEVLFIQFDDIKIVNGLKINYEIIASNIPKKITGSLNIKLV